jgi:hypothetical protein
VNCNKLNSSIPDLICEYTNKKNYILSSYPGDFSLIVYYLFL